MAFCKHLLLLVVMSILLGSCGFTKLAVGKVRAKLHPTPENLITSAPENCFLVTGNISGHVAKGVPLVVVALSRWKTENKVVFLLSLGIEAGDNFRVIL